MIADLKPYPAYKASVPWLREVPEHWAVGTLRRRLRPYDGIKIGPFGSQLKLEQMSSCGYKVYGQANVIASDFARGTKFIDQQKFDALCACEVRPGDLVLTMMGTSGRCARVPDTAATGIMDSHLLRLRTDASVAGTFVALVLDQAPYVKEQIVVAGKGSIMHGLNSSIVKDLVLTFPPLPEQATIVRFLDHADRRIRRYIHAKQKLIKLLEEQKEAIIHRAVTRGFDPNVRLKPSGVEWLGNVPEHWEVMPLRRLIVSRCDGPFGSGLKSSHYAAQGVRVVRLQNIGHAEFKDSDTAFIPLSYYATLGDHTVEPGDLLIAGLGDERHPAGRACVAPSFIVPAMVKADCFRFRVFRQRLDPEFAALHLTATAVDASSLLSTGATRQRTNLQATASRSVAIPPMQEQLAIVQHITDETSSLGRAIRDADREISLLREYRTRLIADVVTGKLDVREAVAQLPDDAEEPDALQDSDAQGDNDTDEANLDSVPAEAEA